MARRRDRDERTPWFVVDHLTEAVSIAGQHGDLLILDLENTLVEYGSSVQARAEAMRAALKVVVADGRFRLLAFISNARFAIPTVTHDSLDVHTLAAARKPHTRLPPLRRLRAQLSGAAVYGDQPLTDGRLARNLGGIWLQPRHAHEPDPEEPWWGRSMRRAGRQVIHREFRRMG